VEHVEHVSCEPEYDCVRGRKCSKCINTCCLRSRSLLCVKDASVYTNRLTVRQRLHAGIRPATTMQQRASCILRCGGAGMHVTHRCQRSTQGPPTTWPPPQTACTPTPNASSSSACLRSECSAPKIPQFDLGPQSRLQRAATHKQDNM
jgi:hypothetical protein